MDILSDIKKYIASCLEPALEGEIVAESDLSYPPKEEMGDLSLPLFSLSKKTKQDQSTLGERLIRQIKLGEIISNVKLVGPYLNFFINKEYLAKKTIEAVKKEKGDYGKQKGKKNKKKILLEFSNVNTHKEYHVGHLRNLCFSDSICKILNACGEEAIPISYVNDFGIHVAKTLWNYESFTKKKNVDNMSDEEKGFLLGKLYSDAASKEKDDPVAKQTIGKIMKEIESRKGSYYDLWRETRQWSIKHIDRIYEEMDVDFKKIYYESDFTEKGKKIVKELLKKGVLKKDQGAIIADLKAYGLDVLVCVRSNDTSAYAVADLALAKEKAEKFKPDESVYIVDNRQSLYFKQLFKILELAGHKEKMVHLSYDFVKLPGGMMSSRSGNVITYNDLKKMVMERSMSEIKKRRGDLSDEEADKKAKAIGMGAIKFEMIKVKTDNIITFDPDKALSFDGFTSSYIQYAYARIAGIFSKAGQKINIGKADPHSLKEEREIKILKKTAQWPETLRKAGRERDTSEVAKYLYELSQILNDYYHRVPILDSEIITRDSRLCLLAAAAQTIKNGMDILGIEVMEEM